jgi:hypothetical protein
VPGLRGTYTLLHQGNGRFVAESDSEISVAFEETDGPAQRFALLHKGITSERVATALN